SSRRDGSAAAKLTLGCCDAASLVWDTRSRCVSLGAQFQAFPPPLRWRDREGGVSCTELDLSLLRHCFITRQIPLNFFVRDPSATPEVAAPPPPVPPPQGGREPPNSGLSQVRLKSKAR